MGLVWSLTTSSAIHFIMVILPIDMSSSAIVFQLWLACFIWDRKFKCLTRSPFWKASNKDRLRRLIYIETRSGWINALLGKARLTRPHWVRNIGAARQLVCCTTWLWRRCCLTAPSVWKMCVDGQSKKGGLAFFFDAYSQSDLFERSAVPEICVDMCWARLFKR